MKQFSVDYLGGHPIYMKKDSGDLRVNDSEISFWSGWFGKKQKFSVPLNKIKKEVQEQNKITLTRAVVLGLASVIFKKKKKTL